jgi:hypothetical protein
MGLVFGIRDPEKNLFRIQDPGVKKAPDPDPQHCQNKYGTRVSGKWLGCIDISTGVVTTGPAANQVVQHSEEPDQKIHCKKSLAVFPSPAGMSLTKLSLDENNLIILSRESLVSNIPAGDG